ncbi:MAG TPA: penicillin-binding protein [Candidatus Dormibacteraeota bacterium]|nr:penicillin-binding protein [Candidatus Dormibacteraeota bacterium]
MKNKKTNMIAGVFMVIFIGAFLIVTGRFIYIQASGEVANVSLAEWAKEKRTTTYFLNSERGKIFDKNGMTLAYNRLTYRLYAIIDEEYTVNSKDPKHVDDPQKTAELLAPILDVEEDFILERIENGLKADPKRFQVEFGNAGKELSQETKDEIEALELPGIQFENEAIRYYPNGMFASHIIGFARKEMIEIDDEEIENVMGVTGIEKEMNDMLSGEDGYVSYERDRYNRKLLDPNEIVQKPVDGHDVYLTIDQKVQTLLEDVMTEVDEDYSPERITAIVMNAKTGEIIAMSNRPSYNPNDPSDVQNWYNDAISTPFEPGSTVKMFTWAAAIEAGVYQGDETFKSGSYLANERLQRINDHNGGKGWGSITYDEGFARSSNVAASKLVWEKLGTEKYLEYLEAFDFDKATNIDLPGEIKGKILYNWPQEKITTGFGQGSTITPIQQMKAATAITNGGKMLQPYIIDKIIDPETNQVVQKGAKEVVGEPISAATADQVIELLDSVVNGKQGTGKPYKLDDYFVIGKTGTAEIPNPTGETSYLRGHGNNIFSFLGMAPKDDPELIMYVSVNQPKLASDETGSAPVAYIFKNVMENSLKYLNITPDKNVQDKISTMELPKLVGAKTSEIKELLSDKKMKVTIVGKGEKITKASHEKGQKVFANDHIILLTDKPTMPDIIGWSLRDVHKLTDLVEFKLESIGNGYVTTQNIKKGTKIKKDDYLGVELELPNTEN